jgi:hypothetical protein
VKRLVVVCVLASAVPLVALVAADPVRAAAPVYDQVTTTAIVAGARTEGSVGASGGLATLDSGSAQVRVALDADSASVLAAPYEPGTLVRTVIGQVNTSAEDQVLDVPDAEANYPGTPRKSSVTSVPGRSAGPVAVVGGTAAAAAGPGTAAGEATGTSFAVVGALTTGGSHSDVKATVDQAAGKAAVTAHSSVASVDVGGVLQLSDVEATGRVTAQGDTHTAAQSLVVGGAEVAGQAVTIGNNGVVATGTPLLPGTTIAEATEQANAVLATAGISVRTVGGRATHDSRSAVADTGGVLITLTQDVAGLGANTLTLVVGGLVLTETDAPAVPVVTDPCGVLGCGGPTGTPAVPPTTTTTFLPGTPGVALPPQAPQLLAPQQAGYVLAGRRFSAQTALLGFATWQMLMLGIPTLYALVERRRRLAAAVPS